MRLNAKHLFLTYPNCGRKQQCFQFLKDKFGPNLRFLLVAQENHASGEPHLHCLVCLHSRCNLTGARTLDFDGVHGNYQVAHSVSGSHDYCRKEDPEPLTFGEFFVPLNERGSERRSRRDEQKQLWKDALEQPDYDSFMAAVRDTDPQQYIVNFDRIQSFGRQHYRTATIPYSDPFDGTWIANTQLDSWALENVTNWTPSIAIRPKSLILIGDSRLGKTAWARKHGSHVYFNGCWNMDSLDGISQDTKYCVWDDLFHWDSFNYKQWLGGQWEFDVSGKYRKPRKIIAWGRPSIVCVNPPLPNHLDNQWVKDNCLIVYVRFRLFQ